MTNMQLGKGDFLMIYASLLALLKNGQRNLAVSEYFL